MYHSLILLAGMLCLFCGPYLPAITILVLLSAVSLVLWRLKRFEAKLAAVFLFGYCWAGLFANYSASQNLPRSLIMQPLLVTGCLLNIKTHSSSYQRLLIEAEKTYFDKELTEFKGKISLGNYQLLDEQVKPGWCGEYSVVLKPVHGRLNR